MSTATQQLKERMTGQQLATASKQVAAQAGMGTVKAFFESQKSSMAAVLPKHVSPDRMLKLALGAMRTTPKLMNCRIDTLMGAIVQCAQLGLEPNTPLGHAYLIPFENRREGSTDINVIIGYKGLIDLARRSGQIVSISAHEVHENDHFDFEYGLEERLVHRPALTARGNITAFYAVAKLKGGGHVFEVMSVAEVMTIRDASQNYSFARDKSKTVWGQHFSEMGRKTVLRRLFKYLPVSIEMAAATAIDERPTQDFIQVLQDDYEPAIEAIEHFESEDDAPGMTDNIDPETGEVLNREVEA